MRITSISKPARGLGTPMQQKMWAFAADYARFKVLKMNTGGVYMDVGSELIRDITPLLTAFPSPQ